MAPMVIGVILALAVPSTEAVQPAPARLSREDAARRVSEQSIFSEGFAVYVAPGRWCPGDVDAQLRLMQGEFLNPAAMSERMRREEAIGRLQQMGLLRVTTERPGRGECPGAGAVTVTALTAAGEAQSVKWTRQGDGWSIPIARRVLLGVTGIRAPRADLAVAEFEWKWVPLNAREVPAPRVFRGQASFALYDDGWRLQPNELRDSLAPDGKPLGDSSLYGLTPGRPDARPTPEGTSGGMTTSPRPPGSSSFDAVTDGVTWAGRSQSRLGTYDAVWVVNNVETELFATFSLASGGATSITGRAYRRKRDGAALNIQVIYDRDSPAVGGCTLAGKGRVTSTADTLRIHVGVMLVNGTCAALSAMPSSDFELHRR